MYTCPPRPQWHCPPRESNYIAGESILTKHPFQWNSTSGWIYFVTALAGSKKEKKQEGKKGWPYFTYLLSPQFLYTPLTNSIIEAMPVLNRNSSVSVVTCEHKI
jgi:hypothetical protein